MAGQRLISPASPSRLAWLSVRSFVPRSQRHRSPDKNCRRRLRRGRRPVRWGRCTSRNQLTKLRKRLNVLPEETQAELSPLIEAYIRMLGSTRMIRGVRQRIEERLVSAERAVVDEAETIAGAILAQAEPGMPAEDRASLVRRAEEVREIGRRLVRNLTRAPFRSFAGLPEGAVWSAIPATVGRRATGSGTVGWCRNGRGWRRRSHLGDAAGAWCPCGTRRSRYCSCHPPGDLVVVDGSAGTVVNPTSETLAAARRASLPMPANASALANCADCRPRPLMARRWNCRRTWSCRWSCPWSHSRVHWALACCAPNSYS